MKRLILGLLFCSNIVIASSPLYVPQVELDLQIGKSRNYGRASVLVPFAKNGNSLPFLNVFGLSDSKGSSEGNIGLGYRRLYSDSIYAGYVFYDKRTSNLNHMYQQLTFGAEYLLQNFEVRVNGYAPIGKIKNITAGGHMERSLPGFDIELGGNLFSNLESYVSFYYFGDKDVSMPGYRLRSVYSINSNIKLLGELSHDKIRGFNYFAGIKLRASLGSEKGLSGLEKKMLQNVVRDIDIVTKYEPSTASDKGKYISTEKDKENHCTKNSVMTEEEALSILGLTRDCSERDINRAFKAKSLNGDYRHPDRGGNVKLSQRLNEAYGLLNKLRCGDEVEVNATGQAHEFATANATPLSTAILVRNTSNDFPDRYSVARQSVQARSLSSDDVVRVTVNPQLSIRNSILSYELILRGTGTSRVIIKRRDGRVSNKELRIDKGHLDLIRSRVLSDERIGEIFKITPDGDLNVRGSAGMMSGSADGGGDGSDHSVGGGTGAAEKPMSSEDAAWHGDEFRKKLQWAVDNYDSRVIGKPNGKAIFIDEVGVADFFTEWESRIASKAHIDSTVNLCEIRSLGSTIAHAAAAHGKIVVLDWIKKNCSQLLNQANDNDETIAHWAARVLSDERIVEIFKSTPDGDLSVRASAGMMGGSADGGGSANIVAVGTGVAEEPMSPEDAAWHGDEFRKKLQWVVDKRFHHSDADGFAVFLADWESRIASKAHIDSTVNLLNIKSRIGYTIAHVAAADSGKIGVLGWIKENCPLLLNQASNNGYTIAHAAAAHGNIEGLGWIKQNCSQLLNQTSGDGRTIAHWAANYVKIHVLDWIKNNYPLLLNKTCNHGYTIAHWAAVNGRVVVLDWIKESCPQLLDQTDDESCTIAHAAATHGKIDVLAWLKNNYPLLLNKANDTGSTIAHGAAIHGMIDMLDWIKNNYPLLLNKANDAGSTIAYAAANHGKIDVLDWIKNNYPLLLNKANYAGSTIAHRAAHHGKVDVLEWIKDNVDNSKDFLLLKSTNQGDRAIHSAIDKDKLDTVKWFFDNYSLKNDKKILLAKQNNSQCTVLHLAIFKGNLEGVQIILKAAFGEQYRQEMILEHKDSGGSKSFHLAALMNRVDILNELRESLPDALKIKIPIDTNSQGVDLIGMAIECVHADVLDWVFDKFPTNAQGLLAEKFPNLHGCTILQSLLRGHIPLLHLEQYVNQSQTDMLRVIFKQAGENKIDSFLDSQLENEDKKGIYSDSDVFMFFYEKLGSRVFGLIPDGAFKVDDKLKDCKELWHGLREFIIDNYQTNPEKCVKLLSKKPFIGVMPKECGKLFKEATKRKIENGQAIKAAMIESLPVIEKDFRVSQWNQIQRCAAHANTCALYDYFFTSDKAQQDKLLEFKEKSRKADNIKNKREAFFKKSIAARDSVGGAVSSSSDDDCRMIAEFANESIVDADRANLAVKEVELEIMHRGLLGSDIKEVDLKVAKIIRFLFIESRQSADAQSENDFQAASIVHPEFNGMLDKKTMQNLVIFAVGGNNEKQGFPEILKAVLSSCSSEQELSLFDMDDGKMARFAFMLSELDTTRVLIERGAQVRTKMLEKCSGGRNVLYTLVGKKRYELLPSLFEGVLDNVVAQSALFKVQSVKNRAIYHHDIIDDLLDNMPKLQPVNENVKAYVNAFIIILDKCDEQQKISVLSNGRGAKINGILQFMASVDSGKESEFYARYQEKVQTLLDNMTATLF